MDPIDYLPSAVLWLADGTSLYDHFGAGCTLLVTNGAADGVDAFAAAAAARGMPLTVLMPHDARLVPRYEARFALFRPDQHVAWRADHLPDDPGPLLQQLAGRV